MFDNPEQNSEKDDSGNLTGLLKVKMFYYERPVYYNYLYTLELEEIPDSMDIDQNVTSFISKYELKVNTLQKQVYIPTYNCSWGDSDSDSLVVPVFDTTSVLTIKDDNFGDEANDSSPPSTPPNKKVRKLPSKVTTSDNKVRNEVTTIKRTSVKYNKKRSKNKRISKQYRYSK